MKDFHADEMVRLLHTIHTDLLVIENILKGEK